MKNQKGITLIALVITIIVLLILAGVAIAMLSGENGILTRAKSSKINTAIGAGKEAVSMAVNEGVTEFYNDKYVDNKGTYANQAAAIKTKIDSIGTKKDEAYIVAIEEVKETVEETETVKEYTVKVSYYENGAASTTVYSEATMSLEGTIGAWTDHGLEN